MELGVMLLMVQSLFVVLVTFILPVVAAVLILKSKFRRASLWLLLISMAASLAFGVYNHMLASGSDNIFVAKQGILGRTFQLTAILLAIIEAAVCWISITLFRNVSRDARLTGKKQNPSGQILNGRRNTKIGRTTVESP